MYATRLLATVVLVIVGGASLYELSNWWERAYATYESSETSPDGCIRIDTYKPFWVLPSVLHRIPDPDPTVRYPLGRDWEAAIFKRAYEVNTGSLLGESIVYNPFGQKFIDWGDVRTPGRRIVEANGFSLVDSDRCADAQTLTRLDAYYTTGKWTIAPSH